MANEEKGIAMKSNENLSNVMKREFKLEDGVKEYMASLPNYQPWDEDTFSLEHPGSVKIASIWHGCRN